MKREAIFPEHFYNMYFICFEILHHSQALQQLFEFSYFTVIYTFIALKNLSIHFCSSELNFIPSFLLFLFSIFCCKSFI